MKLRYRILGFLLLAALVQSLYYYPQLPSVLASHFDAAGRPNGRSSKEAFFGLYAGVTLLLTFCFYALPSGLVRLPESLINLPHKAYWLAPSRRAATFAYLQRRMADFGIASLLLSVCIIQLVMQANLTGGGRLSATAPWLLLGIYGLFVVQWLIRLLGKFARTPRMDSM